LAAGVVYTRVLVVPIGKNPEDSNLGNVEAVQ
jgi:hypothetical protein